MKAQKIKIENFSVLDLSEELKTLYNVNSPDFKFQSDIRNGKCFRQFFLNNRLVAEIDINKGKGFYFIP